MKNHLFLFLSVLAFTANTFTQWQPDLRLTNNPFHSYVSYNNARNVASFGDDVHVVWWDTRDGNAEIFYKRSTDNGTYWGADTRLTNDSVESYYATITVSGTNVHVAWQNYHFGNNYEIYYKRSTDRGVTWEADKRLTNNSSISYSASIAAEGTVISVLWRDNRDGNEEIYYKRSSDGGINFGADTRLTNAAGSSEDPAIAATGTVLHLAWSDARNGDIEIYYKQSTDQGITWGSDIRITNNPGGSYKPSISVSGSLVALAWYDTRDANDEIYFKRSTNGGAVWQPDTRLTNNTASSKWPSVSVSGFVVNVVWQDSRDGNTEIYNKRSLDGGIGFGADIRLTNSAFNSELPSAAVSGTFVHIVWQDQRDGNLEVYYKKDSTGNIVGMINFDPVSPNAFSLSQNYPNPFNPSTNIEFAHPKTGFVNLIIYDMLGKVVTTLINKELQPGTYSVDWNGSNNPSGVYFYKLESGEYSEVKKMVLVK
ncbi:MAG: T9SS type A sorting domain-containing protein [Ignavibacteria bacterium]|nr:T9SS type A sorting domain-containing protein [Ignavibacteria bacterium]